MSQVVRVSGRITDIFPSITASNGFVKRQMWLQEITNNNFQNFLVVEFWKDDAAIADNYKVGDFVTCICDVNGRKFMKADGSEAINQTLKCWNVEKDGVLFKQI